MRVVRVITAGRPPPWYPGYTIVLGRRLRISAVYMPLFTRDLMRFEEASRARGTGGGVTPAVERLASSAHCGSLSVASGQLHRGYFPLFRGRPLTWGRSMTGSPQGAHYQRCEISHGRRGYDQREIKIDEVRGNRGGGHDCRSCCSL